MKIVCSAKRRPVAPTPFTTNSQKKFTLTSLLPNSAGGVRHRRPARPIVMTTVAMGAGMLPVALGLGAEPSFRSPMAIAVIGGLITSTFLSLLVIPVVFTYVDDLLILLRRLLPRASAEPAVVRVQDRG